MRFLIYISFLVLSVGASAMAQEKLLAVDLAEDHVDITTGFNGARLTLFGVQDEPGDIAIVISGPKRDMVVRQKRRLFGIWTNAHSVKFENVPVYYDYALADVNTMIATPEVMKAHSIGMEALRFDADEELDSDELKTFQDALIRNKRTQKYFPKNPQDIVFIKDNFFKTSFYIPANVPTGAYEIKTYLLQKGAVRDIKTTDVRVAQVGTSAGIYSFSRQNSVIYGLLCVMFAMTLGWISNAVRRRI